MSARPRVDEFIRTIPLNISLADPLYRLSAVDIYADATIVRWTRAWPDTTVFIDEHLTLGPMGCQLEVSDDVSTDYDLVGATAGTPGVSTLHAQRVFSPEPPPSARMLHLTFAGTVIDVAL